MNMQMEADKSNDSNNFEMLEEDAMLQDEEKDFGPEDYEDEQEGGEVSAPIPNHLLPPNKRVILDQERYLPIANVSRIIKRLLPSSGKVAKEAKECVQECVSEFISFLTSEACERVSADKRKTISADDLMKSMINMGFDDYIEPMEIFMRRYREINRLPQRPSYRTQTYTNAGTMLTQPIAITLPSNAQFGQIATTGTSIQLATASQISSLVQGSSAPVYATVAAAPASTSTSQPTTFAVVSGGQGGNSGTAVESMPQIMVDPSTNQHYMMVENPDGTHELRPVQILPCPPGDQYSAPDPTQPSTSGLQNTSLSKASSSSSTGAMKNAPRMQQQQRPGPYQRTNRK